MKAHIVLGLQFGDEGKGRTVDYLSQNNPNSIVVRFSGGQNCGHTVIHNGIKHIFTSYGSATMRGVPTYVSEHCTLYLNSIDTERKILIEKGFTPKLIVHPKAMITTPYDVYLNRFKEKINNHGSCGVGISTTMKRNLETGYKLYAVDLKSPKVFLAKLEQIKNYISLISGFSIDEFNHEVKESEERFLSLINSDLFEIENYKYLYRFDTLIFEGSQGIMLDMDHGIFPNVTYANTTSKNAMQICDELFIKRTDIHTYYITRCYQTRHGNGWMSNQEPITLINNEEEINVYNKYQGSFKIGELDYDILNHALEIDLLYNFGTNKNLVVTCLDQRPDFVFDYFKIKTHLFSNIQFNSPSN